MIGESHDLAEDFPEYRERIQQLRQSDEAFAAAYASYQRVNKEVVRTGLGRIVHSDGYTAMLKRLRVQQKDRLYRMLRT